MVIESPERTLQDRLVYPAGGQLEHGHGEGEVESDLFDGLFEGFQQELEVHVLVVDLFGPEFAVDLADVLVVYVGDDLGYFGLGESLDLAFESELELAVVEVGLEDDLVDLVLVVDVVSEDLFEPFDGEVVVLPQPVLDLLQAGLQVLAAGALFFDADLSLVGALGVQQEGLPVLLLRVYGPLGAVHGSLCLSEGGVVQQSGTLVPQTGVVNALGTAVETVPALFQVLFVGLHCLHHLRGELHAAFAVLYHQSAYLGND